MCCCVALRTSLFFALSRVTLTHSACAGGYAAPRSEPQLTLAQNLQSNTVSTSTPWVFPLLSEPNKTCTASCNGEDVDTNVLHLDSEAKTCVGTFKVSCTVRTTCNICEHKPADSCNTSLLCRSSARETARMATAPVMLVLLAPSVKAKLPPSVAIRQCQFVKGPSKASLARDSRVQMASLSRPTALMAAWVHQLA